MLKKFMIVCMCVAAVVAVFGLNDRITYQGFQEAGNMISGSASVFDDDVETLKMIAHVVENFGLNVRFELLLIEGEDGGRSAISVIGHGSEDLLENFYFSSAEKANQIYRTFIPISWGFNYSGLFDEAIMALNAIVMLLGIIFTFLFAVAVILFDTVSVALTVVEAGLYLLGF